ncbi:MAG TPA: right-handed parallel beta-helix repeat-containing protein [Candidatus Coprenecus avistercoris]|uniref:Right-handed parallel beta-helix repeat-containing protein n=1 Tax=Candidatus Coprenecus avistercoris TaxID=2840730 RepID=A0A9D1E0K6_9BACT|nr:right-handed parallel beta-helix repeat-containing protein [Candidatus Coprenecus avistercoris]
MKTKAIFVIAAAAMVFSLASCEKDPDQKEPVEPVEAAGEVSGVWEAGSTVYVDGHIVVPEGESLTIEEGVTVIFSDAGVGVNHTAIEFSVDGNLYCLGTAENPVRLTVDESLRTADNTFAGLWGGIVAGATCEEMLIDHTIIEYCGGQVIEGSPAAENGYYTAGDDAYPHITTNNVDGRYVITNSILRNGWSDAIYMMGGNAIIAGNIFSAIGYDGAEAVNVKSGCTVDVTRNIMFSANTNGLKLSSSDQSEVRHQAKIQAYNNTIIGSGWRRDGEKGGGIYVEENADAGVFNNLLVNCKFRATTPAWEEPGSEDCYDGEHSMIDYNYYASGTVQSSIFYEGQYEDDGEMLLYSGVKFPYEGYAFNHEWYDTEKVDVHSVMAKTAEEAASLDPKFVNFDLNMDPASYTFNDSWDFHLAAGSPALDASKTYTAGDRQPYFGTSGLEVNGQTYTSPAIGAWFGAYGE